MSTSAARYVRAFNALRRARARGRLGERQWSPADDARLFDLLRDLWKDLRSVEHAAMRSIYSNANILHREAAKTGPLWRRLGNLLHDKLDQWLLEQPLNALESQDRGSVIFDDGRSLYLIRVYLYRRWRELLPGLFIHRFFRSDGDRELHNHPWKWALALVLTYGYLEVRVDGEHGPVRYRRVRPFTVNLIRHDTFHRVQLVNEDRGAWTLFLAGPRSGSWGFMDPETRTFEDWRDRAARIRASARDSV